MSRAATIDRLQQQVRATMDVTTSRLLELESDNRRLENALADANALNTRQATTHHRFQVRWIVINTIVVVLWAVMLLAILFSQ